MDCYRTGYEGQTGLSLIKLIDGYKTTLASASSSGEKHIRGYISGNAWNSMKITAYIRDRYMQHAVTMGSVTSMYIGRRRTFVASSRKSTCLSSRGAYMRDPGCRFRAFFAFRHSIAGPKVSGRKSSGGRQMPASMSPNQKGHLQPTYSERYPAGTGYRSVSERANPSSW